MGPERQIAARLRPLGVRDYASSRGWEAVSLDDARFWLFRHPQQRLRQLQIPMDDDDPGFVDAMLDIVARLAELEGRSEQSVLADLLMADADVLRVRVQSRDSDGGQLPLTADVALREGTRRALASVACSIVNPATYHPRLNRSEANALLAACRAGQTEVGSYVFKVVCPLHAVPDDGDPRLPGAVPFTRRVTTHLMRATSRLVRQIERGEDHDVSASGQDAPMLSWNLCDALLRMQPEHDGGSIELSTSWAADHRVPPPNTKDVPSKVAIKADYFAEIGRVARALRPDTTGAHPELLIGTVEALKGDVGPGQRRAGEVQFSLLLPDSETLRARAALDAEQYATAVKAHERGLAYVRLRGVLHRGQRISRIHPLESIDLIDDGE